MRTRPTSGAQRSPAFPLLGETLLVGVAVALASIPLVTALPAVSGGVRHLRHHLDGQDDSLGALAREIGRAVRALWLPGVVLPAALLVLAFNLWLAATGLLPGGRAVAVVSGGVGVGLVVVALRFAGAWSPAAPWPGQLRAAARRTGQDLTGTVLLVGATVAAVALVRMLPPMALLVGGLLALAALSVETRAASRGRDDERKQWT